jgi:hypothetical protein
MGNALGRKVSFCKAVQVFIHGPTPVVAGTKLHRPVESSMRYACRRPRIFQMRVVCVPSLDWLSICSPSCILILTLEPLTLTPVTNPGKVMKH